MVATILSNICTRLPTESRASRRSVIREFLARCLGRSSTLVTHALHNRLLFLPHALRRSFCIEVNRNRDRVSLFSSIMHPGIDHHMVCLPVYGLVRRVAAGRCHCRFRSSTVGFCCCWVLNMEKVIFCGGFVSGLAPPRASAS